MRRGRAAAGRGEVRGACKGNAAEKNNRDGAVWRKGEDGLKRKCTSVWSPTGVWGTVGFLERRAAGKKLANRDVETYSVMGAKLGHEVYQIRGKSIFGGVLLLSAVFTLAGPLIWRDYDAIPAVKLELLEEEIQHYNSYL